MKHFLMVYLYHQKNGRMYRQNKGSMIMLAVDGNGVPLNVEVESVSTHEGHVAEQTVDGIKVKKQRTHSRSKKKRSRRLKSKRVIADKGYDDDDGLRAKFARHGIDFVVPYRDNRVHRPYEDSRKLRCYRRRWKVERSNAWLKNFCRVALRWDHSLIAYKDFVHIACICITLIKF